MRAAMRYLNNFKESLNLKRINTLLSSHGHAARFFLSFFTTDLSILVLIALKLSCPRKIESNVQMSEGAHIQVTWADKMEPLPYLGELTREEIAKHNTQEDCWIILNNEVYNITPYLKVHPAGPPCIMACAGGDLTEPYMKRHRWVSPRIIEKLKIGTVKKD